MWAGREVWGKVQGLRQQLWAAIRGLLGHSFYGCASGLPLLLDGPPPLLRLQAWTLTT